MRCPEKNSQCNTIALVAHWFYDRTVATDPTQALPLMFQSFQDDLLQVAVGHQAELIIDDVEFHTLREKLGIELSNKSEACRPLSCSF